DYVFAYQRVTRVNPAMIEQYRTTEAEFIGKTPRDFFAHDLAQGRAAWRRLLDQGRLHLETKERRFDGTPMYVEGDYVCLYDAAGRITGHFGIQRDVTERKRAEAALQIQHTVAVALNEYRDLNQALAQILETVCQLESIDSGGVYLPDPASGALELAVQRGLSPEFLKEVAYFGPDAPQSRLVRAGRVIYGHYEQIRPVTNGVHHQEGLHAVAILPVMHQGELLAVLNLASHTHADIPADVRTTLETLALQIGSALARLRFEAALAESRQNLQTLFDTINDFLFVLDQEGHICQTNPVVWQRLGYKSQELLSQPVLVVHSPDRHAEAAEIMAAILAGERDHCSLPLQTRTGALIPVETRVTKGTWSGRPALFGLARDITVRQRVEETLRQSEERFRLLLDSAPDAIFIAKIGTGIIIEANTAAARLLAKPKPEIIGMHFSELHPPEMATESRQMFTTHVFESDTMGEGLPVEYVALRADGQRVPVEVAARVIELQGEKLLMGIFRDIT
ncbi:MAG TPA: PAS domain S-box protein, partial [Anaerolineae bacterium]|nr:PAS domain S-box protein [Anaerolineae bacterium]